MLCCVCARLGYLDFSAKIEEKKKQKRASNNIISFAKKILGNSRLKIVALRRAVNV